MMMMMSSIAAVDDQEFMERMNNHGGLEFMDYEGLKRTEDQGEKRGGEILQVRPFPVVPKRKRSCPLVILAAKALLSLSQMPPFNFKTELGNQNLPKTSLTVQSSDSFAATGRDCFKKMKQNPVKFKKRGRENLQEEEDETRKKKKEKFRKDKKKDALIVQVLQPPPDLPQELKNYIDNHVLGGGGALAAPPVFVIQKALTKTDLSSGHNRLSMPHTRINGEFLENFLTEDEKTKLKRNRHIQVSLIDPSMHEYSTLQFTRWPMSNTSVYVLMTDWNTVWIDNRLEQGMIVQIWSFRVESNTISFALAVQRN